MSGKPGCEGLMREISEELGFLRQSILERDIPAIEAHTQRTRDLLTDLRPMLIRQRPPVEQLNQLRQATRACAAVVVHVRQAVRALQGLYRSILDPISSSGTYEVRR